MQLHFIANASVASASGRTIPVIDPSDGQPFDEIQRGTADDIDAAVHAARQCYHAVWQKMAPADRGRLLQKLSAKILEHADELTALRIIYGQPYGRRHLTYQAVKELAEFLPAVREAKLEKAHVVKEVRATFSARPGLEAVPNPADG